jgi:hypothetical protein
MTRLNMIPEQQFAEDFRQLRRDIEEIKQAQRIGRDIMRPRIVECLDGNGNPTPYDLVTVPDGFRSATSFTATFTADNQQEPWGTLFVKAFYGSPGVPVQDGQMSGIFSQQKTVPGAIGYRGFVGTANFGDTTVLYLKFYMYATDTGVLEVYRSL